MICRVACGLGLSRSPDVIGTSTVVAAQGVYAEYDAECYGENDQRGRTEDHDAANQVDVRRAGG